MKWPGDSWSPGGATAWLSGYNGIKLFTRATPRLVISNLGNVGIGTTTPTEKLAVNGNVRAKELKVETANWPDYVFKPSYQLMPLRKVESFIKKNGHLPDVLSAKETAEKGVEVGANQALLLKKIEELTLYIIEQNKINEQQDREIRTLEQMLKSHR